LETIDNGTIHNKKAPQIAIDYWKLSEDATLRDVVIATQKDEEMHRDVNHGYADILEKKHHN
jgi:ubiquinol oxidase